MYDRKSNNLLMGNDIGIIDKLYTRLCTLMMDYSGLAASVIGGASLSSGSEQFISHETRIITAPGGFVAGVVLMPEITMYSMQDITEHPSIPFTCRDYSDGQLC